MAKYSTGSGGGSAGESCELCGAEDVDLQTANVAGATLQVCPECAQHDERDGTDDSDEKQERQRRAAQNTAKVHDAETVDSSRWEDGADYDDDQLPYLVPDYGERVTDARQAAGLQTQELADEIGVDESDVLAVEQGRATQAGIGGSTIAEIERVLDVELVDAE